MFVLTIILLMLLADAWWWVWADRQLRGLPRARLWRGLLAGFMTICVGGLIWVVMSRVLPGPVRGFVWPWLVALLFVWHFLIVPVVTVPTLLAALLGRMAGVVRAAPQPRASTGQGPATQSLSRRELLRGALVAAPPLVAVGTTARSLDALDEFRVRRITVPILNLPADLDGLSIAHVSDVHVGSFTRGRTLDRIVAAVNSLRADLVLQTGDLINHALADLPAAVEMSRRFDARLGMFMCEGNHDLIESRWEFERRVRAAGLPLLVNERAELTMRGVPVQVLGLRWGWVGPSDNGPLSDGAPVPRTHEQAIRASLQQLLSRQQLARRQRNESFQILLAHHPHAFDYAAHAGIPLTLAGHTHGGQLMAGSGWGFGPWMFRYWSGLYQRGGSSLVVSNGVGNWFPVRINAPAEIIHITLRRA